jgi:hypothetical protein
VLSVLCWYRLSSNPCVNLAGSTITIPNFSEKDTTFMEARSLLRAAFLVMIQADLLHWFFYTSSCFPCRSPGPPQGTRFLTSLLTSLENTTRMHAIWKAANTKMGNLIQASLSTGSKHSGWSHRSSLPKLQQSLTWVTRSHFKKCAFGTCIPALEGRRSSHSSSPSPPGLC